MTRRGFLFSLCVAPLVKAFGSRIKPEQPLTIEEMVANLEETGNLPICVFAKKGDKLVKWAIKDDHAFYPMEIVAEMQRREPDFPPSAVS